MIRLPCKNNMVPSKCRLVNIGFQFHLQIFKLILVCECDWTKLKNLGVMARKEA